MDPNWGDGTQAWTGRFFANSAIEVCLAHLLLNYNVKLKDGQARPKMVSTQIVMTYNVSVVS